MIYISVLFILVVFSTTEVFSQYNKYQSCPATPTDGCFQKSYCKPGCRYRTFDGSCNNPAIPWRGKAGTPFKRMVPTTNCNNSMEPLRCKCSSKCPLARDVRRKAFPDCNALSCDLTYSIMNWGQFITHDILLSGIPTNPIGNQPCCPNLNATEFCLPLEISPDDPRYQKCNQTCMEMRRSEKFLCNKTRTCETNNTVTHFHDGSMIYGSSEAVAKSLRTFTGGKLKSQMLPVDTGNGYCEFPPNGTGCLKCNTSSAKYCFKTGDFRSNQHPMLTCLHTLFVREHNRIVIELAILNPYWNDERLYQEARRIIIAIIQCITYSEWLVYVLGEAKMEADRLTPTQATTEDFDCNYDPSIGIDFNTGSFRFFHTLIQDNIQLLENANGTFRQKCATRLSNWFSNPDLLVFNPDSVCLGTLLGNMQKMDGHYSEEISEKMFRGCRGIGLDLPGIDIQRHYDQFIPSYNEARVYCGLNRANTWAELKPFISDEDIAKLSKIYACPDDIPMMVGIGLEIIVDGLLGPTGLCIISKQFQDLKFGDRYFFTEKCNGLNSAQIQQIFVHKLSSVFCLNNCGSVTEMPLKVWLKNEKAIPCEMIPKINLTFWKEEYNYTG